MSKRSTDPPPLISFDDDGDEWQDMPVVLNQDPNLALDEEDRKKFHYVAPTKPTAGATAYGNATGNLIDFDDEGQEWRSKLAGDEGDYTRLRLDEDQDNEEVHLRTKYLFNEDKAMTPISQMKATKELLTESQRIAYVGLCAVASREMVVALKNVGTREVQPAVTSMELWALKIMGRLYHHMELEAAEQKMIESLAEHGVTAEDLAPSLMTTHTVRNPDYDPAEAKRKAEEDADGASLQSPNDDEFRTLSPSDNAADPSPFSDDFGQFSTYVEAPIPVSVQPPPPHESAFSSNVQDVLTPRPGDTLFANVQPVFGGTSSLTPQVEGVSTALSATDENVTLDIRWTVLCDLFLALIADSVYDARSRVLLETVASKLGIAWLEVARFEKRVTDALEIEEGVEKLEQEEVLEGRRKKARNKRYMMMGLATLGGGLVIGLSAGLLAPVIGAGLGAAFTTIGVTGTTAFLGGAGGAAVITTGGVLTGSAIAGKGMSRRTKNVRTFALMPLHNNKRVNCIITVPGFMSSIQDDVRLPFSVLDPIVGDVFSVLWEPEMMMETGNALKILTTEVLTQVGQTVLQATVMTGLMSALTWPLVLTKLGYLIDNPWSNALERARAAGLVLADTLRFRSLGVRPISLIGFSLGARVIFYALVELAKQKAMGIVQDVVLLGATVTASTKTWHSVRSIVAGRLVNGYARNDWVLSYLFRASAGGLYTIAGLRPIPDVPGVENVDLTDKIAGHASYRIYMPVILHQLGFPVTADYFDEAEELEMEEDRIVSREEAEPKKKRFNFFSRRKKEDSASPAPPNAWADIKGAPADDLPERNEHGVPAPTEVAGLEPGVAAALNEKRPQDSDVALPLHAGFDFKAITSVIDKEGAGIDSGEAVAPLPAVDARPFALERSGSAPPYTLPTRTPWNQVEDSVVVAPEASLAADLAPRFERAVSLQDVRPSNIPPRADELPGATTAQNGAVRDVPSPPTESRDNIESYGFPSVPAVDFGDATGSIWSHTPDALPEPAISFGTADGTISFAPTPSTFPVTPSFGTADGNITYAPPLESDPWAPPPVAKAKKATFTGNPWG